MNERLQHFFNSIAGSYDFIIIDTSPVMGTSDALAIGQLMDTELFVTRYGVSTTKHVDFAIERLNRAQIPVQGIIFNSTQQSRPLHEPETYSRHQSQTQLKTGIGVRR